MIKDDQRYRIITDQVGSVRLVVNAVDGTMVQRIDYTAFGEILEDTNPGFQPFGFAGGLYDADTGLVRFGARDYDPRVGRWTAKDPILFAGQQTNLYVYVGNDPVNRTDPEGLWGVTVSVGGGFASGFGSGFVPVGGGGGNVGFFIGTEGFGTVKSVHYTNGIGHYGGVGASLGVYHSLDRLNGYSLGGKVVAGQGVIGGLTTDFTTDGEFAAAAVDLGGGIASYAGGTLGATSVSNWFEEMRDFFLEGFDRNHGKDRDCK